MLSGKAVNKAGLMRLFESLWKNKAEVRIEDYTDNILILTFESEAAKEKNLVGTAMAFCG